MWMLLYIQTGVGVTDQISYDELQRIVSEPVSDHLRNLTDFNELMSILDLRILGEDCIDVKTDSPDGTTLPSTPGESTIFYGLRLRVYSSRRSLQCLKILPAS